MGYIEDHHDEEMYEDYLKNSKENSNNKKTKNMSEIVKIISEIGVSDKNQKEILEAVKEIEKRIPEWHKLANIKVTSIEQVNEMQSSREGRLGLVKERTGAKNFVDAKRKVIQEQKSEYDKADKAWLKIFQYIEKKSKDIEAVLQANEDFLKNYEAEQKQKLYDERFEKLVVVYPNAAVLDLGGMAEETFNDFLEGQTFLHKKRIADEAAAEKEAEEKRVREENQAKTQKTRLVELTPYLHLIEDKEVDISTLWQIEDEVYAKIVADKKALLEKEQFDAQVKQDILLTRITELSAYSENPKTLLSLETSEEDYQKVLEEQKKAHEEKAKNLVHIGPPSAAVAIGVQVGDAKVQNLDAGTFDDVHKYNLNVFLKSFNYDQIDTPEMIFGKDYPKYKEIIEKFNGFIKWGGVLISKK